MKLPDVYIRWVPTGYIVATRWSPSERHVFSSRFAHLWRAETYARLQIALLKRRKR